MTTPNQKNQPAGAIPVYQGAASSAVVTASEQVKSSAGVLASVAIGVSGSGTISFYDGTSASGKLLWTISQATVTQQDIGVAFSTGLYVSFSAAGATANVTFF